MSDDTITALPIEQLHESPFNPRKTFASAGLQELADSIRAVGVQQPIKVRTDGRNGWEVIFGHRRLRAAALAGLTHVPGMVCDMTDAEAARAQIAENLEREDLHPIEEAEGYAALMQDHGVTADELVQQTGKSRSYIYGRLKLLQACPMVRNACLDGTYGSEVVLLLARLRTPKLQEKALGYIQGKGYDLKDGGARSYRHIRELLAEHFTLALKDAIFDPLDATLLPDAGACDVCPKRVANAPEFQDLLAERESYYGGRRRGEPNTCTDPDCFAAKKTAHLKRKAAELQAKGKTVVDGNKARAAVSASGEVKGAYIALKDVKVELGKLKGRHTLAGKPLTPPPTVTIQDPRTGKTFEAVKREDVKAAGVKLKEPKKQDDWAERQRQAEEARAREIERCRAETGHRRALLNRVRAAVAGAERSAFDLQLVAKVAYAGVNWHARELLHELWDARQSTSLDKRLATLSTAELTQFVLDCALVEGVDCRTGYDLKNAPPALTAAAKHYGVERSTAADAAPTPSKAARAPKKPAAVATEEAATA
jgi:ParB/RepB/Spo0J family partition protein